MKLEKSLHFIIKCHVNNTQIKKTPRKKQAKNTEYLETA